MELFAGHSPLIIDKQYRRAVIASLLLASFFVAHLCFLTSAFQPWNLQTTDLLFDLRNQWEATRPEYDRAVAYVEITDSSGAKIGAPYLDRAHYAQLIRNLSATDAALQVHDAFFRAARLDAQDEQLVEATRLAGNVVLGFIAQAREANSAAPAVWPASIEGTGDSLPSIEAAVTNFRPLNDAAWGQGFLDVQPDIDGVFRRTPLIMRGEDGIHASLGLTAACAHLDISPEQITVRPGRSIRLGDDIEIPIDRHGNMRINFIGPWEAMEHYRFERIYFASEDEFELELLKEHLQNRVLVIADVTTDQGDIGPSPFDSNYPLAGIHANVLHSIITGHFLRELDWQAMLPIELLIMTSIFFIGRLRSTTVFLLGSLLLLAILIASAVLLFLYCGIILHQVRPPLILMFGITSTLIYRYLVGERARAIVQTTFEAYFPPNLVRKFVNDPDRLLAHGRRATLSILFSDIKGFTSRTSSMDPADVQEMLNEYFSEMVDIVFEHGGTLDKFIGDGLMVFFGDPEEQPDHADRAVKTAMAMQQRMREINRTRVQTGEEPMLIRIGINTGEVLVGNMGSSRRLTYTALGSAVNLAARIEPAAPSGGVLISETTARALNADFSMHPVEPLHAKGFVEPVNVFEVLIDDE